MKKKNSDQEAVEQILKAYAQWLDELKQRAMDIEFRLPHLSEQDRAVVSGVIREMLIKTANTPIPAHLRDRVPPELMKRFEQITKTLIPDEH
jgi:hypothetical protein